jgi:branched-subunit amino acid ABC-type transport system permease component
VDLDAFLVQFIIGLYKGSFYWLLAVGLTLIFGVTRIINFAHAAFFVTGGYLMYTFYNYTGSFILSLVLSSITTGLLGALSEVILIRRVYRLEPIYQLLLTFGIALVVNELQKILWGKFPKYLSIPDYLKGYISIGGVNISYYSLTIIILGFLVFLSVYAIINMSLWGLRVRAVWRDRTMAQILRINPYSVYTSTFFLGTALAGLGGSLMIALHPVGPGLGDHLIIYAFIVVVITGLGNIVGAYITSLLIGVVSSLATWLLPEVDVLIVYSIAALVLLVRPEGLFGER